MIARLTVVRGATTEYPLAERVNGGWQNGVTFYPDADVTEVVELHASRERGQAAEALATLARIRGVDEATNEITLVVEAQVHATLALVEQQRIANLIALSNAVSGSGWQAEEAVDAVIREVWDESGNRGYAVVADHIKEALGLS